MASPYLAGVFRFNLPDSGNWRLLGLDWMPNILGAAISHRRVPGGSARADKPTDGWFNSARW